jgi:hypothetical protein
METLGKSGTCYTEILDKKSNAFVYRFQSITTFPN